MDTVEKGWQENREDYLRKAYSAIRASGEPVPLNEAVNTWEMLTDDTSKHYFWRALGNLHLNRVLEIERDGDQTVLDADPAVSLADIEMDIEDVEISLGDKRNVRKAEKDSYREFGDFEAPVLPTFVAWEHLDRNSDEKFPYEDPEMQGVVGHETNENGAKETWLGFYNHDGEQESSTWINQIFRGREIEGEEDFISTEDLFTDRNRERYMEDIWEDRPTKLRQRAYNTWDAAVKAVEEKLPELQENYLENAETHGWDRLDEFDVLKREFRLMVGDDEYNEENPTYIEQIVDGYYGDGEDEEGEEEIEGLHRDSSLLQPFLENIESTPYEEGDMNLDEATRGSPTSEAKKQRNQAYMSHYLDLVWQLADEKYREE
ncbi:MAG: hypothetical protein ABEJ36_01935 [Candidatus Nanosalina sp.]